MVTIPKAIRIATTTAAMVTPAMRPSSDEDSELSLPPPPTCPGVVVVGMLGTAALLCDSLAIDVVGVVTVGCREGVWLLEISLLGKSRVVSPTDCEGVKVLFLSCIIIEDGASVSDVGIEMD